MFCFIIVLGAWILSLIVSCFLYRTVRNQKNELQAYRKMLANTANEVASFERKRIARDLHDEIGSKLSIVHLNLNKSLRNFNDSQLCESLTLENFNLVNDTIENTRKISKDLMLAGLTDLGYKNALLEFCRQINNSRQVNINLVHFPSSIPISELVLLELYRITQEALNNILKHSYATEIAISVYNENQQVVIKLLHNGNAFTNDDEQKVLKSGQQGSGLKNMRNRARFINATIEYSFSNDKSIITVLFTTNAKWKQKLKLQS